MEFFKKYILFLYNRTVVNIVNCLNSNFVQKEIMVINRFLLKALGIQISFDDTNVKIIWAGHFVFLLQILNHVYFASKGILLFRTSKGINEIIQALNPVCSTFLYIFKYICLYSKRNALKNLMQKLQLDWTKRMNFK